MDQAAYLVLSFLILLAGCIYGIRRYSRSDVPLLVQATTLLCWLLSFSVIVLLPMDLVGNQPHRLQTVWDVLYWISFCMCWAWIPMAQEYYASGAFTFRDRVKASVRENLIFYAVALGLLLCFIVYLLAANKLGKQGLVGFLVCASNTWGLTLVTLLLGYALVEAPRHLWYKGRPEIMFRRALFRLTSVYNTAQEVNDELLLTRGLLQDVEHRLPGNYRFRPLLDMIKRKCPDHMDHELIYDNPAGHRRRPGDKLSIAETVRSDSYVAEPTLVKLHTHVKRVRARVLLAETQWRTAIKEVLELEAVVHIRETKGLAPPVFGQGWRAALLWRYHTHLRLYLWSFLAVVSMLLSLLFVWMEVTIVAPDRPNLSPIGAWIDHLRPEQDSRATVVGLLFFAILNGYVLFSLFRVHIYGYYKMSNPHQTDTNSMLVNASFLLRLLFPLGYNFIQLLHLKGTTFSQVMDQMDIVPFLGEKFTAIAPMMIVVFCLATLFNLYGRILKALQITRFEYGSGFDESAAAEGKMLLRRVKRGRGLKAEDVIMGTLDPGLQMGNQLRAPLGAADPEVVVGEDLDAFLSAGGGAML